jgi:hypothetical protein
MQDSEHLETMIFDARRRPTDARFTLERGSELIGLEFPLHSVYKRVETTEPHFQ